MSNDGLGSKSKGLSSLSKNLNKLSVYKIVPERWNLCVCGYERIHCIHVFLFYGFPPFDESLWH